LGREEVARDQRARIYGAMVESIARRGYARTTVAHVIGLAGVSRRAFYEQFSNKEHCFLATYDILIARSRKRVLDAWSEERGWANRLHSSCKTLLDEIVKEQKGSHLVLIDSLGIGCKGRERLHLAGSAYERLTAAAFKVCPDDVPMPAVASRAIVGGVRHVVFNRMREGRVSELRNLTDELLDWVEAYRSPATTRLNMIAPKRPPDIPLAPAAFLAGDDKRARVLGSVVHLTLDEGYAELTDPQIAQFAGISTEAFHKQFPSKEECFLTVVDEFASEALRAVQREIAPISVWADAVPVAMRTFIDHIVSHPALLRMAFVDLFEVGPGMIGRMTKSIDRFTALLAEDAPQPRRAPEIASEAITGAVWDIISAYSSAERMRYLPCLADHIAFVVLAPYIGPKAAVDAIEQARLRPRSSLRARVAAAKLAAPPIAQPQQPPAKVAAKAAAKKPAAKKPAKTPAKKPAAKVAAKTTSKPAAKVASKPAAQAPAKTKPARPASRPAAKKASRAPAKASTKPAAKKAAKPAAKKAPAKAASKPERQPTKKSTPRSSAKRSGSNRSRPRPPK
jgi:AcrR family transcriptional regulator